MALTDFQQAERALRQAKNILITFPAHAGGDAVGSSLTLAQAMERLGKRVDVVAPGFVLPGSLRFLPNSQRIGNELGGLQKFIINVSLAHTPLQDLSYSVANQQLSIYLTPQRGSFNAADITTQASAFNYDLIITVDVADLDSLGALYHNNTEFFYHTTILNLDHSPANEYFGQINLVDVNVPACADLAFELIEKLDPGLFTPDLATCLYTGLSAATKSFTSTQVTPATLARAAKLVTLGARREEVVTHLYRTKQLSTLKLWGRVLARLKSDSKRKLVWSLLQPDDFVKSAAGETELTGVIDELITTSPEAGTVVLLYELKAGTTSIFLHAGPGRQALELLKPFGPHGDRRRASAQLPQTSLLEAEKRVIEHLRQIITPLE